MTISIRSGKHPHEVALLLAAFLMGVLGTFFFKTVASTTVRTLPYPSGHILYGALAVGSLASLAGIFWPGIVGALVERAGLIGLVGVSAGYAGLIFAVNGPRGMAFTTFLVAFAAANVFRVFQISQEIKQVQAAGVLLDGGEG